MGDNLGPNGLSRGCKVMLQIEISEIVVAEADEPDAVVDFPDAEAPACEHGGDVDPLAVQADAAAGGDENVAVVERIGQFGHCRSEWRGADRVPGTAARKR